MNDEATHVSRPRLARPSVPRWRKLLPLVGFALLAWVLSRLDLREMRGALASVSSSTLLLASGAFSVNMLIKAWRWQRLLIAQGIVLPLRVTLAAFLSGQFYGQVTLGRVGEFMRVEALFERGVSAGAAFASSVFDRVLDLFLVLLAGAVFAALVFGNREVALLALGTMLLGAVALYVLLSTLGAADSEQATGFLHRQVNALGTRRGFVRLVQVVRDLARGILPMLRAQPLTEALGYTLAGWCFYFLALFQLADGLGLHISRILLTATAAFAALSALLPITVSGLGARELIYITVLQQHGAPGESAAVLSLLHLFVMTVSATGFGALGVLWRQRQKL